MYEKAQEVAEKAGNKGLSKQKLKEVKKRAQKSLRVPNIYIGQPLSEEETQKLADQINRKMKNRLKGKIGLDKATLERLWGLGYVLDQCEVGLFTLLKN